MKFNCLFLGTSEYSLETLKILMNLPEINVIGIITQKSTNVKKKNPVESFYSNSEFTSSIPIYYLSKFTVETVKGFQNQNVDISVVCSYGVILPDNFIKLPKLGTVNLHPSLLPKYRGATPVQTALLNGDNISGVTLQKMKYEMDEGDIIGIKEFEITNNDYIDDVYNKIYRVTEGLLNNEFIEYLNGELTPYPQSGEISYCYEKDFTYEKGRINPLDNAEKIVMQIKAFESNPGSWVFVDKIYYQNNTIVINKKMKIYRATTLETNLNNYGCGDIIIQNKDLIMICNKSAILINVAQFEGGKKLFSTDIVNGLKNRNN